VSTSANLSGQANPKSFKEIDESIKSGVDAVLELRLEDQMTNPSQIIKISLDGSVVVIRH
jgi:L-threonylcarbamoyladenylate synthase